MVALPTCMSVCYMHARCPCRPEEGTRSPAGFRVCFLRFVAPDLMASLQKDAQSGFLFLLHDLQLAIAKNNIIKLQEENHQLRSENELILMRTRQHLEVRSGYRAGGSGVTWASCVP